MLKFPGMRPTAQVVAIVNKSVRRQQVVGIMKQEHAGDVLALIPADPRMPRMMVNAASMPLELRHQLQVCLRVTFWTLCLHLVPWLVQHTFMQCIEGGSFRHVNGRCSTHTGSIYKVVASEASNGWCST